MRKYATVNKILSGFSVVLSLSLLLTCIWTLTSLLIRDPPKKCVESKMKMKYEYPEELSLCNDTRPTFEDEDQKLEPLHRPTSNYTEAIVIENDGWDMRSYEKYLAEFDEMNPTFRIFVIICLSGVILSSLGQLVCSFILIFSPYYKVSSRSRRIVIVLFVVFLLYLVGFGWPLAYKRIKEEDEDDFQSMSTLSTSFLDFCNDFQWYKLVRDLNLYYIELFFNSLFLFFYMVTNCCLLRFVEYEDYDP